MNAEEKILSMLEFLMVGQEEIKASVARLESEVGVLKSDVGSLKSDVSNLQQGQVRIENDHGKKLDALFDGYSQLYEIFQEMRDNIKGMKEVQGEHELYIKWHESRLNAE